MIVEGRVLMKKREILTIDTDRVRLQASELGAKIQAALAQGLKE